MENILHIDMDAFYASIEENDNPEYRNKPLAVVGHIGNRSVVSTANYAARKYKIFSALPLKTALNKYPKLIVVQGDFSKYTYNSRLINQILHNYTPEIEQASIDEFYLNVEHSHLLFGSSIKIAKKIKKDIYDNLHLTCSIGISGNRLLSKIGSDLQKPDGLTIINKDNFNQIIDPLKIEKIPGIGKKTAEILHLWQIHNIKELRELSLPELKKLLGVNGYYLYNASRGIGSSDLSPSRDAKSISNEITLEYDSNDIDFIKTILLRLSEKTGRRLREKDLKGKTIKIKVRYFDFKTISRQMTLNKPTNLTNEIYKNCEELIQGLISRPVRLIGIGLSSLQEKNKNKQLQLFKEDQKEEQFEKKLDTLSKQFGSKVIKRGSLL